MQSRHRRFHLQRDNRRVPERGVDPDLLQCFRPAYLLAGHVEQNEIRLKLLRGFRGDFTIRLLADEIFSGFIQSLPNEPRQSRFVAKKKDTLAYTHREST